MPVIDKIVGYLNCFPACMNQVLVTHVNKNFSRSLLSEYFGTGILKKQGT